MTGLKARRGSNPFPGLLLQHHTASHTTVPMSEHFDRIEAYFAAFSESIERCRTADTFKPADWQDAYNRLSRLRDRYIKEKPYLTPSQQAALAKVFENDHFIEGLLDIRQIGEHVHKRTTPTVPIYTTMPIDIPVETSAGSMFEAPFVMLEDTKGRKHPTDHLHNLEEAKTRITRAIARAKDEMP